MKPTSKHTRTLGQRGTDAKRILHAYAHHEGTIGNLTDSLKVRVTRTIRQYHDATTCHALLWTAHRLTQCFRLFRRSELTLARDPRLTVNIGFASTVMATGCGKNRNKRSGAGKTQRQTNAALPALYGLRATGSAHLRRTRPENELSRGTLGVTVD